MKHLIALLFLLFSFSVYSQELVGVNADTRHVYYSSDPDSVEINYFKIYRDSDVYTTSYTVNYTVSGAGVDNTDISNGSVTFAGNQQFVRVKVTPTSKPSSDEEITITVLDGPQYNLQSGESSTTIYALGSPLEPAFEGAIGAGKYAGSRLSPNTWRGKDVYKVTSLADSGPGTFRDAMGQSNVGYIIFWNGGTLNATSKFGTYGQVQAGKYVTGVLAPGDGVLIKGNTVIGDLFRADRTNDMVFSHFGFTHALTTASGDAYDVFNLYQCQNIYVNHMMLTHSDDETASALAVTDPAGPYEMMTQTTFAYNHFSDGFYSLTPTFKNHSTTIMMGSIPDLESRRRRATMVGYLDFDFNLTTQISHRHPNFQSAVLGVAKNNVIANHKERIIQSGYPQPYVNWEGNYIVPGPNTSVSGGPFTANNPFVDGNKPARSSYNYDGFYGDGSSSLAFYFADGNVMENSATTYIDSVDTNNNQWAFFSYWFDIEYLDDPYPLSQKLSERFPMPHDFQALPAREAFELVTGQGGAGVSKRLTEDGSVVFRRNTWAQGKIDDVVNDTQSPYTESPEGWASDQPTFPSVTNTIQDGDDDGMPDVWELSVGLESDISNNCASCTYNPNRQGTALHPWKDNIEIFLDLAADTGGGGSSPAPPTCSDGIQNGDETGVDCGGSCPPCDVTPPPANGVQGKRIKKAKANFIINH